MNRPSRLFLLVLISLMALTVTACGRRDRSTGWEIEPTAPTTAALTQTSPASAAAPEATPTLVSTNDLNADPLAQELLNLLGQLEAENAQGDAFGDLP